MKKSKQIEINDLVTATLQSHKEQIKMLGEMIDSQKRLIDAQSGLLTKIVIEVNKLKK